MQRDRKIVQYIIETSKRKAPFRFNYLTVLNGLIESCNLFSVHQSDTRKITKFLIIFHKT